MLTKYLYQGPPTAVLLVLAAAVQFFAIGAFV